MGKVRKKGIPAKSIRIGEPEIKDGETIVRFYFEGRPDVEAYCAQEVWDLEHELRNLLADLPIDYDLKSDLTSKIEDFGNHRFAEGHYGSNYFRPGGKDK